MSDPPSGPDRTAGLSWAEAVATVTAPGGRYAWHTEEVAGVPTRVFDGTPTSLRVLWERAARRGDDLCLVYEDERWSYRELFGGAADVAATLRHRYGVTPGDRVAIAMRNYPEWIASFAAVTALGAVAVPLNAWWTTPELAYGLADAGCRVVLADRARVERLVPVLDQLDTEVIAVRWGDDPRPAGVARLEDVVESGSDLPAVDVAPDDDATILYTSGTTGHPKGAVSTHRAVLSAVMAYGCAAAVAAARQSPQERAAKPPHPRCYLLCVPLFHVTGCVAVMLNAVAAGSKLVMMVKWDPERALELIERERVTVFVGVPTMSWDLLESPSFADRDTSSLVSVGGGGAPAPPELVRRVDRSFARARPTIGYGMTETNAYGPGNSGDDYLRKPTSAGRTVPVVEVRVADPAGTPLPPGEVGEIWFRGPNLIRGYWNRPEATAEAIVDGWLRSGDLGHLDEEGFVFVSDRAKDMVLRGGENVYCAEVEAALYEHPAVYEAAVFGVPHPRLGEEVAAAIVPKEGCALDVDQLVGFLAERLAGFKVPTRVEVRPAKLPRNASGKILKRAIRDEILDR